MVAEFTESKLGSLLAFANGRSSPARSDNLPYPVYGSNGIIGHANESNSDEGTIVIGRVGSYCGSLYLCNQPCWVTDNAIRAKALGDNDPRFLFYLLTSLSLNNWRAGSGQPLLNQEILSSIPTSIPQPSVQRAIGHILGSLDEKNELNLKTNQTLEAMARAIFKSWFVDFDPVRAKAEGRDTGLPANLAALFPGSFENSSLGYIPKGWKVNKIEDVADRVAMGPFGSSIKVDTFVPEGVPVISGQHLRSFMLHDYDYNFVTYEHAQQLKNANVYRGDVIFTHAGSIGQVAYIPENSQYERYVLSQRQFYMRCNLDMVSPGFITCYFKTEEGQHKLLANTSSTGVPSISRPVTYLRSIELCIPPKKIINEYEKIVQPMHNQIRSNINQSISLTALRNTLLPKLLSGEIRVHEAN